MNIGDQIQHLRKREHLSQDEFANLLYVSRQTVSNWETGKSCPDLETLIRISDHFGISVDALLGHDSPALPSPDDKAAKHRRLIFSALLLVFLVGGFLGGIWFRAVSPHPIAFTMQKEETYQTKNLGQPLIDAGTGYFTLPESGDLHIEVDASTDDGTLHVVMTDTDGRVFYQLDGQTLEDAQTLYFDKGSYVIQITADAYTQDIVTLEYQIEVRN